MRHSLWLPLLVLSLSASHGADSRTVQVIAVDYALQAPDALPAGSLRLAFANHGRVAHEVVVGLLRPEAGKREMVAAGQQGLRLHDAPEHYLQGAPIGALFAWPGQASPGYLVVEARRGQRYALFCMFRDSLIAPEHAGMGMVRVLSIR